ncbi:MAG: alpha-L-glycero-D-manno-heptose beta-1,4-glucosyltransferase [Planctomycetaceae bacterium]|nr:alpha-L-glycero-D-manno-heptose beta-1,4-glucosyltransferase [Planctomycetaceae bacterium]
MNETEHSPLRRDDGTPSITAYVIAYNEVDKIEAAISSVLWADEVILADSHSTDGTTELAERLGARVVQIDFDGFGKLRNEAIAACRGDWIFSLDADERCTAEARDEILRVVGTPSSSDIYKVPRRNWFMGRWIKGSGWYPNFRQPQLFRNGKMTYDLLPVHEGWIPADGATVAVLEADIWQFPFKDLAQIQHKIERYSTLGAEVLEGRAQGSSMVGALGRGLHNFFKHYVLKMGFRDGWPGFIIALSSFEGSFYKHAKRVEAIRHEQWSPPPSERLDRP